MNRFSVAVICLFLILLGSQGDAHGWPWTKDMHEQPSIKPGELLLKPPEGTLPVEGGELPVDRMEADEKLSNPIKPTEESIARGKMLYNIYCHVCHGEGGKGNGPVAKKFLPPPDLTAEFFKQRSDGFIYVTIKEGGAVMPPYGEDMTPRERWHLVNYLRRLQGK